MIRHIVQRLLTSPVQRVSRSSAMLVTCAFLTIAFAYGADLKEPCTAPEYRQFDFWKGAWTSYDTHNKVQGHLVVRPILNGCALEELWTGTDGGTGRSFSIFDASRKVWNQTWVSSHGTLLPLEGRLVGKAIVLTGQHVQADGQLALHRTIWTPLANGDVHQVWDYSLDGGQTWEINYDGHLRRESLAYTPEATIPH